MIKQAKNGLIGFADTNCYCMHCERKVKLEELEAAVDRSKNGFGIFLCKCKRRIGVTVDIKGDYVVFERLE